MTSSSTQTPQNLGESYLRLQLDNQTQGLLPMKYAQEVLVINSEQVSRIPNMPPCVMGLVNQRNGIYWLIDLPLLLSLDFNCKGAREYNIAFMEINNIFVGLVVKQIKGVTRITSNQIQSSWDDISESIIPYLNGWVVDEGKLIYILDAIAITEYQSVN